MASPKFSVLLTVAAVAAGFGLAAQLNSCTTERARVDAPSALTPATVEQLPRVKVIPQGSRADWLDCLEADRYVRPWNQSTTTCNSWRGA